MADLPNYSVLSSVYFKENPEYLKQSIDSILHQTVPTNDFVIVEDGPLTNELNAVLDEYAEKNPCIHLIKQPQNSGLGAALNVGLKQCKNEFVARMDTDDISLPDRCEKELKMFVRHPELDIVGTAIYEFSEDPDRPESIKEMPRTPKDIKSYARRRNPFNHPTVMYKKTVVVECGGYQETKRGEDFALFTKMVFEGHKGFNINKPLLKYRTNDDQFSRRTSRADTKAVIDVQLENYKKGYVKLYDLLYVTAFQIGGGYHTRKHRQEDVSHADKKTDREVIENKKVSVIMPAYNAGKFIEESIKSVLDQTYSDLELIIIDDCSSDNTKDIVNSITDTRVHYYKLKDNGGVGRARNVGIKVSSGRYLAFCDSDDIWVSTKIEKQLERLRSVCSGFSYTAIDMIDEDDQQLKGKRNIPDKIDYKFLLRNTAIATSSVLLDRNIVGKFYMPVLKKGEDYVSWLRLLRKYGPAYGINEALVHYRVRSSSLSGNKLKNISDVLRAQIRFEHIHPVIASFNAGCYAVNGFKKHFIH